MEGSRGTVGFGTATGMGASPQMRHLFGLGAAGVRPNEQDRESDTRCHALRPGVSSGSQVLRRPRGFGDAGSTVMCLPENR